MFGTLFTAPQFASIQALINQKAGGRQGNPNPIFYDLARSEYGSWTDPNTATLEECNAANGNKISSACTFRDVTVGNIETIFRAPALITAINLHQMRTECFPNLIRFCRSRIPRTPGGTSQPG